MAVRTKETPVLDELIDRYDQYARDCNQVPAEIVITARQAGHLSVELSTSTIPFVFVHDGAYFYGAKLRVLPEPRGGTLDLTDWDPDAA